MILTYKNIQSRKTKLVWRIIVADVDDTLQVVVLDLFLSFIGTDYKSALSGLREG